MTFNLDLLPKYDLSVKEDAEGNRHYVTPIGLLPSVTTVLGRLGDKTGIKKWKERVGDDVAKQIIYQSQRRGDAVHNICEDYLLNEENWKRAATIDRETFFKIRPILDKHIKTVYGIELAVWSKELQCAGRTDGIVMWDNQKTILDFKTASHWRKGQGRTEKLSKYMLQATVYAMAVEEIYNLSIPQSVIVVMIDHEKPYIKSFNNHSFRDTAREIFKNIVAPPVN